MKHNVLKHFSVLALSLLLVSFQALAQRQVTGKITDGETGEGVPGASVIIKGTTTGTISDFDGNYTINVDDGSTLVISFVGYTTAEVAVGARSVVDVSLSTDLVALEEIVVVGYGTQEKKEITSSVASVSAEDFNQGAVQDPVQLLQGKVAGLSISRPGGDPNGGFDIRLRGLSTIGANASPLVVIDGIIGGDLGNVDPNDIASIDILKDGSAAAIYGTRGSSGVILITTKSGQEGTASVNYNTYVAFETRARELDVLNADEFRSLGAGTDFQNETDWMDEITQTGVTNVHNLSMSGGTSQTSYRASVNVRDVEGIQKETGFTSLNARLNLTQRALNDKLTLTSQISTTTRNADLAFPEAFRYATVFNPTAPVRVDGGEPLPASVDRAATQNTFGGYFETGAFDFFNPVAIIEQNEKEEQIKQIVMSIRGEYDFSDIIEGFRASAFYSQQRNNKLFGEFYSKESQFRGIARNGLATRETEENFNQLFESTLNYDNSFGKLDVGVLVGYSFQEFIDQKFGVRAGNFLRNDTGFNSIESSPDFAFGLAEGGIFLPTGAGGSADNPLKTGKEENTLIGYFGRVNLNYDGTYFFSASIRREGSTRFGENNRWGNFPAVSGGVALSNLFDIPTVDDLKLRVSYGETGNQPAFNFLTQQLIGPVGGFFFTGSGFAQNFGPLSNSNPDLKWERKREFDIGIDFSLAGGKLTGTADWYTRTTDDLILLVDVPVPPNLFNRTWQNGGELKNTGFELALTYAAVQNANFSWTPSINFSTFNTELVDFVDESRLISNAGAPGLNGTFLVNVIEGEQLGKLWGPRFTGTEGGVWNFENDGENQVIGNGLPDFQFGFNNTLTYGNWDLNVFFRGSVGHDLLNMFEVFYGVPSAANQFNVLQSALDLNDQGFTDAAEVSSFQVENATFLKLDNFTLGYNVNMPDNSAISNLRFYLSGNNIFTITGYGGADPEVRFADPGDSDNGGDPARNDNPDPLAPGIDRRSTYFQSRIVTVGANISF